LRSNNKTESPPPNESLPSRPNSATSAGSLVAKTKRIKIQSTSDQEEHHYDTDSLDREIVQERGRG